MVALMRAVGMAGCFSARTCHEWWRKTVLTLPLPDDEIRDIADNRPPYLRRRPRNAAAVRREINESKHHHPS